MPFITALLYILFHLLILHFYPIKIIDIEALEYGEFAASFVFGFSSAISVFDFLFMPMEGSQVLLSPFFIPFFYLLGPTLFALKAGGIFLSSLFVLIWHAISREIYPTIPSWSMALLFIVPFPCLQNAALSGFSMMTHLGAATWFGLLLLISYKLQINKTLKGSAYLSLLALAINVGIFYHKTLIVLLPGIFYVLYRRELLFSRVFLFSLISLGLIPLSTFESKELAYLFFIIGHYFLYSLFFLLITIGTIIILLRRQLLHRFLKSFKVSFKKHSLVTIISFTIILVFSSPFVLKKYLLDQNFVNKVIRDTSFFLQQLQYLPGTQAPFMADSQVEGGQTFHIPGTLFLYLVPLIISLIFLLRKSKLQPSASKQHLLIKAVALSSCTMAIATCVSGLAGALLDDIFDGLRYLIPYIPLFSILLLYPLKKLPKKQSLYYLSSILFLNIMGTILFLYPFERADFLTKAQGYIGNFPLIQQNIDKQKIFSSPKKSHFIPWYGARLFYEQGLNEAYKLSEEITNKHDQILFLIGAGMAQNMAAQAGEFRAPIEPNAPQQFSKNCFFSSSPQCSLSFIEKVSSRQALQLGWLLTTPCMALNKALGKWSRSILNIENILWSKPDFWECHATFDWNSFNKVQKEKKVISSYDFDSLFPLQATTHMQELPEGKTLKDYSIYIGWIWLEYVEMRPGSASLTWEKAISNWKNIFSVWLSQKKLQDINLDFP